MFTGLEAFIQPITAGVCILAFCVCAAYVLRWFDGVTAKQANDLAAIESVMRNMQTQLDMMNTMLTTTRAEATLLRNRVCELEDRERHSSMLLRQYGQMEAVYTFPPAIPDPRPTFLDSHRSITLPRTS